MEILILILFIIILVSINLVFFKFFEFKILEKINQNDKINADNIINSLNQNIEKLERTKDLISTNTVETYKIINSLNDALIELKNEQKFANEISKDLKYFFDRPKLRGGYGEVILTELVSEILPTYMYQEQYTFSDKTKVDLVIKYKELLIPIDSKFPVEEYKKYYDEKDENIKKEYFKRFIRQLKEIGDSISSKYIKQDENTTDFAIMFIPSDSIYIEAIQQSLPDGEKNDLFETLLKKKVLLAGPSTFFAFLNVILAGLKQYKFLEISKDIIKNVEKLNKNLEEYSSSIGNFEKRLKELNNAFEILQKNYKKTEKSFKSILDLKNDDENKNLEEL